MPPYTGSVDAILALISAKLPLWGVYLLIQSGDYETDSLPLVEMWFDSQSIVAEGYTGALALCAAFCRAMAAQEEQADG